MGFTCVDDPYEPPANPELTFDAATQTVQEGVAMILNYLVAKGFLKA
jgi:adenylylsulfate kinase-like enzyme